MSSSRFLKLLLDSEGSSVNNSDVDKLTNFKLNSVTLVR